MINWPLAGCRPLSPHSNIAGHIVEAIELAKLSGIKPTRVLLGPVKWAQLNEKLNDDMADGLAILGVPAPLIALAKGAPSMGCQIHGVCCEEGKLPGITVI